MSRVLVVLACVLVAVLASAPTVLAGTHHSPGAAAVPRPPDCGLVGQPAAREYPIAGTGLVATDPYGGVLSNPNGFVFRIKGSAAALAATGRVEWALDGVTTRSDATGPVFTWGNGQDSRPIAAGAHTVRVTVVPRSGAPASVQFNLTATDCPYIEFQAFPSRVSRKDATDLTWDSARNSDRGTALTAVSATAIRNIVSVLPRNVRGKEAGTLTLVRPGASTVTRTLRVPKRGHLLLSSGRLRVVLRPGAKEFLTVTGLPTRTQTVHLLLQGLPGTGLVHMRDPCRMALIEGVLRAGSSRAADTSGGHYACAPK